MHTVRAFFIATALLLAAVAGPAGAVIALPPDFVDEEVGSGLLQPVNFDFLPDGRVLLVERATARIRLVVPGTGTQAAPVGKIPDVSTSFGESGLLGIAVDPRWPAKPYVYVHHTCVATPNVKVVRYALTGDLDGTGDGALALDSLSRREVLSDLPNDFYLHNGGTLVFGPDEHLFVALGDDGIRCSAQDRHQLRGKILRLDVRGIPDGPGPVLPYAQLVPKDNPYWNDVDPRAGLVWHRGLRNPWSFDIEPHTGRMAIADVGEASWEEVSVADTGGRNFGWPYFEGPVIHDTNCGGDDLSGLVMPAYAYPHVPIGASASVVLGGICFPADEIVESFPSYLWGDVFVVDLYAGRLLRIEETAGSWALALPVPGQPDPEAWGTGFLSIPRMRFGRDGGLWYVTGTQLRRITYEGTLVGIPPGAAADAEGLRLAAWPSPTTGAVTVEFATPRPGARLEVFDARGRQVRAFATAGDLPAGAARRTWDARLETGVRVAPGLYFVRLEFEGELRTRRVVVLP